MPKICKHTDCSQYVFGKGYCKSHQYLRTDKPITSLKRSPIRPVSKKLQSELAIYRELSRQFKIDNPKCMANLKGCTKDTQDVHHLSGRGKNLNNVDTWVALCRFCHDAIHFSMSSEEARQRGLKTKK
jgi:hypothetical protein